MLVLIQFLWIANDRNPLQIGFHRAYACETGRAPEATSGLKEGQDPKTALRLFPSVGNKLRNSLSLHRWVNKA